MNITRVFRIGSYAIGQRHIPIVLTDTHNHNVGTYADQWGPRVKR